MPRARAGAAKSWSRRTARYERRRFPSAPRLGRGFPATSRRARRHQRSKRDFAMIDDRFAPPGAMAGSRRAVLRGLAAALAGAAGPAWATTVSVGDPFDVTFLFTNDIHACRVQHGLNPNCFDEGKTDRALRRHVAGINRVHQHRWPKDIAGTPTGLRGAGERIAVPRGLVLGGDMTDDGGGQTRHPGGPLPRPGHAHLLPGDGRQLVQFNEHYRPGATDDSVSIPVYPGLGNPGRNQDGPSDAFDWYREELRGYVKANHMRAPGYEPPVPVTSYDEQSDSYSWDWDGLHLVQAHRCMGDTTKGAVDNLPWIERDLAAHAGDGRPVIICQHYGWDPFSAEHWDPEA